MASVAKKPAKPKKKVRGKAKAKRTVSGARVLPKLPAGYSTLPGGKLLIPADSLVEPNKLRKGLTKAKDEINDLIQEVIDTSTTDYAIHEIEFAASFSADGKFMGIGVGGAATITFKIRPCV